MPKYFRAPAGTYDMLEKEHRYFTFIKKVVRHRFRQSGFTRITTPMFEDEQSFVRALGEDSDVVGRELYKFMDRTGKEFALRPEITTGVVRSFIQHEMYEDALPKELYYIEPCFRFERPSRHTSRQFWQFGAEILGETDPSIDAQLVYLAHRILADLEIRKHCTLKINTVGTEEDRAEFFEAVANFYAGKERSLTPETLEKLEQKKYYEVLTPRSEDEEILAKMAPKITDFLSMESNKIFEQFVDYLTSFDIDYEIDTTLTPEINYYNNLLFKFEETRTKKVIISGGRYDGLVEKMGCHKDFGGVGFAARVDRVTTLMESSGIDVPHKDYLQIFVAATGPVAKKEALPILVQLREHGFHAVGVLGRTSIQDQLERAQKFNVPFMVLIGDIEMKKGQVIIRDMKSGKQRWIDQKDLLPAMEEVLGMPKKLDTSKDIVLDDTVDFLGHS